MSEKPSPEQPDETPDETPDEPRNRAERRAQQRGKKIPPGSGSTERYPGGGHRDQVMGQQRRAGRRGNR